MNLTAWLDVALGLIVVYLGASLCVTVINEYVAQVVNWRGRTLHKNLKELLDDEAVRGKLSKFPALAKLLDGKPAQAPSYVDSHVLARLLAGTVSGTLAVPGNLQQISDAIDKLPASQLKAQLQAIARSTSNSADALVDGIAEWTEKSLTALGETYTKNLQWFNLLGGFIVAAGLNLDTVALTVHLYTDKEVRDAAAALAVEISETTEQETFKKCAVPGSEEHRSDPACVHLKGLTDAVRSRNDKLGKLPIGWSDDTVAAASGPVSWPLRVFGWCLTALAISLGAPFWFDLLNRVTNVRYGMRKPQLQTREASKAAPP